jgi:hypothetical protein
MRKKDSLFYYADDDEIKKADTADIWLGLPIFGHCHENC